MAAPNHGTRIQVCLADLTDSVPVVIGASALNPPLPVALTLLIQAAISLRTYSFMAHFIAHFMAQAFTLPDASFRNKNNFAWLTGCRSDA